MFSILFISCQNPEIYLEITNPTNKSAFVEGTEIHFIAVIVVEQGCGCQSTAQKTQPVHLLMVIIVFFSYRRRMS